MEPGLDGLFQQVMNRVHPGYGQVQFLDRTAQTPGGIPYREKLKRRLETILVGDQLAQTVRKAFDAYLFLSYRKKDRSQARQLMELIHEIPFCRDVAIWYDEYLVPGEAWSQAINQAIDKSALVVLAVTPSLAEPGNYIVNHEYPDARKAGKYILPAGLTPTDPAVLDQLFPDLPQVVDCRRQGALERALAPMLGGLGQKDRGAGHDFLMGLAYLNGIDVEQNRTLALKLIAGAAQAGLPEAMEKLAQMYQNGDGLARDYQAAADWLKRLVQVREQTFHTSGTQQEGTALLQAQRALGQALLDLARPEEAKLVYQSMLEESRRQALQFPGSQSVLFFIISCDNLGRIAQDRESWKRPGSGSSWASRLPVNWPRKPATSALIWT